VDDVGPREGEGAAERLAERASLEREHGHDEADGGEPGERRQHEEEKQELEGEEDDEAGREGPEERHRASGHHGDPGDARGGQEHRPDEREQPVSRVVLVEEPWQRRPDGDRDADGERPPGVVPVGPDRLAHDLAGGPFRGRQRRREVLQGHVRDATPRAARAA
jgi:hypothetical protein